MGKLIDVEISRNQARGYSLIICNKDYGHRISGAKVGGCDTVESFTVDAEELIKVIREHAYCNGEHVGEEGV